MADTEGTSGRTISMKWTVLHDTLMGREVLADELWKYKAGSRERGQCLDKIADKLNDLSEPVFLVTSRSVRDRLKVLERDFKRKENHEKKASGISPERTELDILMEEYILRSNEAAHATSSTKEKEKEKETADKVKASEMRNKAMERLGETKKKNGNEPPKKKQRACGSETLAFLKDKSEKDYELRKGELELKRQDNERRQEQMNNMLQLTLGLLQQQQQQTQAMLGFMNRKPHE